MSTGAERYRAKTPEQRKAICARNAATHRALVWRRRAEGMCVCTAPLAVRGGRTMKACETCLRERTEAKRQ